MTPNGVGLRPQLVLASASPRRRELLQTIGVCPQVWPVDVDETALAGESAHELVIRLAQAKAIAAAASHDGDGRVVVIGADTVITLDDEILGKPASDAEARTMLSRLSGRSHQVVTGVAVLAGDEIVQGVDESVVRFRSLDAAEIDCYVASGEPRDKAGAYAIQGHAALFVDRLEGSFHGVVGLPVNLVDSLCRSVGWSLTTWCDGV